jgi:homoserine O-acetyltransferase/O-succinyltransferase
MLHRPARTLFLVVTLLFSSSVPLPAQQVSPQEGDFVVRDFRFASGETLPELRLHYTTLGKPARDTRGRVTNAVLVLHGTGGSGRQFLAPQFAGVLFGPGQLLDTNRYYIILPDGIGHGRSSKPSDGLHGRLPQYDYDDMVAAQHRLVLNVSLSLRFSTIDSVSATASPFSPPQSHT